MKTRIKRASRLAWALMLMVGLCHGQAPLHAQDNVIYERGYTQVENVLPPAPEAASAVKYVGVPMNLSEGTAELTVPIYELAGRHLRIPVSLHYRSGGVKVDEIAGVAGLGWMLEAGGVITREVQFMPDEYQNWYFYKWPTEEQLDQSETLPKNNTNTDWLKSVLWRQKDTQSDRYRYSVCGLSGTFILTPDREVRHLTGNGSVVSYDASSQTFMLTGPDGTRYYFSTKETGKRLQMEINFDPYTGQPVDWTATTAWHLTSITSADGTETATLGYANAGTWECNHYPEYQTWISTYDEISHEFDPSGLTSSGGISTSVQAEYYPKVLSYIMLNGNRVDFSYESESSQVTFADSQGRCAWNFPRRLSEIEVSAGEDERSWTVTTGHGSGNRIVLNALEEWRGGALYDRWSFNYAPRGGTSLYSQDWYGYNNGETGRTSLCPYHAEEELGKVVSVSLDHGRPDPYYAVDGMLVRADHDGAVTAFTYEGNWLHTTGVNPDSTSIGVRVREIAVLNGTDTLQVRRFSYEDPHVKGPAFPSPMMYTSVRGEQQQISLSDWSIFPLDVTLWHWTLHDTPVTEGISIQDAQITYGLVTEEMSGPSSAASAGSTKTVYHYSTNVTAWGNTTIGYFPSEWLDEYTHPITGLQPFQCVSHEYCEPWWPEAGLLERKEVYRWNGSSHVLTEVEELDYHERSHASQLCGYRVHHVMQRFGIGHPVWHEDMYHYAVRTPVHAERIPSVRRLITVRAGGNDTTVIGYNGYIGGVTSPQRPSWIQVDDQDGFHEEHYSYPDSQSASDLSAAVDSLRFRHILTEPVACRYLRRRWEPTGIIEFGTGAPVFVARTLYEIIDSTTYSLYPLQGGGVAPLPSRRKETRDGVESWRETVLSRDCLGNIRSVKAKGSPETVLLWSYKGRYPVARIEGATAEDVVMCMGGSSVVDAMTTRSEPNATEASKLAALRGQLPTAHVYTYEYVPGFGMSKMTDPAGVTMTYEYDGAGRLKTTRDGDGKKLEEWTYSLLNPGTNRLSVRHKTYCTQSGTSYAEDVRWWNTLGLAQEDISIGASGDGKDLVTAYEGDFLLHDDVKTWLPYPATGTSGMFQVGAASLAATYHGNALAYTKKGYELSTRDKVERTALPGYAGAHEERTWEIGHEGPQRLRWEEGIGIVADTVYTYWAPSEIMTTVTEDADARQRIVQTDHYGKVLASAWYHGGNASQPDTCGLYGNMESPVIYVYDNKDQLRAVAGSGIALTDTLNMWRYGYDALGRLSSKGVPGAAREYYTYDNEDRIIAVARPDALLETEYDAFGRVVKQWLTLTGSQTRQLIAEYSYDIRDLATALMLGFSGVMWAGTEAIQGKETYAKLAILDSDNTVVGYAERATRYDEKGRPTYVVTRYPGNLPSTYDVHTQTLDYDFCDNPVSQAEAFHTDVPASQWASMSLPFAKVYLSVGTDYDLRSRITAERTELSQNGTVTARDTTLYSYDALGRLSARTSSSGGTSFGMEKTYALQGWTTEQAITRGGNALFREKLWRDSAPAFEGFSPSYTGRITRKGEYWASPVTFLPGGGIVLHSYPHDAYAYDHAGRLQKKARVMRNAMPVGTPIPVTQQDREVYSYDTRGNLTGVSFYPVGASVPSSVEQYSHSGDRLSALTGMSVTYGFMHDALGRMTHDGLSDMDLSYNHLDLPEKISRGDTVLLKYSYLSDGMKVSALNDGGAGLVYRGSLVFRRDSLGMLSFESALIAAGRITAGGVRYHVTDHLGSVRAVVDGATGDIVEVSDYAAYGERLEAVLPDNFEPVVTPVDGYSFRYHFTGQEDQGPVSVTVAPNASAATVPYTDFGARQYSPSLRRWLAPDPLSEKYYDVSPYAYCAGDPVNAVDVDGMDYRRKKGVNSITIRAHYVAKDRKSLISAQQGIGFWNNRKKDIYTDENGKTYKIRYNLSVSQLTVKDKYWESENTYEINDKYVEKQSSGRSSGITINKKHIYVNKQYATKRNNLYFSSTPAHEIGHSLGMEHSDTGVMSPSQDRNRTTDVLPENIQQMMTSTSGVDESPDLLTNIINAIKGLFDKDSIIPGNTN